MIHFQELKSTSPLYPFLEDLWIKSFVKKERRETIKQRNYCDNNPLFHCCLLSFKEQPIGLLNYWIFKHFSYIEHFAITPQEQNKKHGEKALNSFFEKTNKPIILEIEIPKESNPNTLRRQQFYKKLGFSPYKKNYFQPPYRSTDSSIPLQLMIYRNLNSTITFDKIKTLIYKEVYDKTTN